MFILCETAGDLTAHSLCWTPKAVLGGFAVFETCWPGQNEEIIGGTGAFTLERQRLGMKVAKAVYKLKGRHMDKRVCKAELGQSQELERSSLA